ncbi:hypothetical protein JYT43_00100 [Ahrensia sp. AH-315-G08]|nr:hypothetical protein [Ahrensia sp. AH-315-G08]
MHHLTPEGATGYLIKKYNFRYSVKYFAKLRCTSTEGPKYIKHGGRVFYLPSDLDEWVKQRTHAYRTTAERHLIIIKEKAKGYKPASNKRSQTPISRDLDVFKLLAGMEG